ncbi:MAG: ATP-binding cassette domain-containing protein [Polyangiaceae bacterium]|nr:ATP-binding cassette domain-containing protein [Polyangiaceae bacterium]
MGSSSPEISADATNESPPRTLASVVTPALALLRGCGASLSVVTGAAFAQRLALPLAAVWIGDRGRLAAAAVLIGAGALSLVRARAADVLARTVRLRVVEIYTAPLERGDVVLMPSPEIQSARLATGLPLLVGWAVDGVAVLLASALALPVVTAMIAVNIGPAVLPPLIAAGLVGGAVTMVSSRRVESAWALVFERTRQLLASADAGFSGAVELVAHGRGPNFVNRLRHDVMGLSRTELGARTTNALASWGAVVAAIVTALVSTTILSGQTTHVPSEHDIYRTFLLVLSAAPTLQMFLSAITNVLAARNELASMTDLLATPSGTNGESARDHATTALDPSAEIRVERVTFSYPRRAGDPESQRHGRPLLDLELVLPAGESLAVLGPNGSGKTTLLYLLLGLVSPVSGRIVVGEREANEVARLSGDRVAFVSQRPFEPPEATIEQALLAFDDAAPRERLLAALDSVGLLSSLRSRAASDEGLLSLRVASLSRGQARRVMIARALVRDAKLIVLDEPEAHLDTESVAELDALLRRLSKNRRIIAAVHNEAVTGFAHHVLRLGEGQTPLSSKRRPKQEDRLSSN